MTLSPFERPDHSNQKNGNQAITEADVLITESLAHRQARQPDLAAENQALCTLAQKLSDQPQSLLKTLVEIALTLCRADTAGVSLLETAANSEPIFRWVAIAGVLASLEQSTTPGNFSPCNTTLHSKQPQLYAYPERYFTYLHHPQFPIVEGLLLPLYANDQPLGTLWILSHHETRHFDAEDRRLMNNLAGFTVSALHGIHLRQTAEEALRREQVASEVLQQNQSRFEELIGNVPGIVYRYLPCSDNPHRFTFINFACRDLLELEPETILQDAGSFVELIHPDDLSSFQSSVDHSFANFLPWCWEGRIITPSGQLKWIQGSSQALHTTEGDVWDGLVIDITARKEAELLLQQAKETAETTNRIKDEFLAMLSHELRSPLNPILGWTSLLRTRQFDEQKTQQILEVIERNAKLQAQLIDDLLNISRILQGKLVLNVTQINLAAIVAASLETVSLAAEANGIVLESQLDLEIGRVRGDAARLQQIVWNLLSNAIKFTPSGGQIQVRLQRVDNQAQLQVQDSGKGISATFLPYVFEYFRQEDSTTTRQFGGLGLGLALVRYLTELHGGTVEVESPGEGLGATFTVRLPLSQVVLPEVNQPSQTVEDDDLNQLKILVVEDEADTRELLVAILREYGANVSATDSASEALHLLPQFSPDLLLCDIGLPIVDGYTLIRQIRQLSPQQGGQIPAIALTAYAGETNQCLAIEAGFQRHIAKPVDHLELVRAIISLQNS